MEYKVLAALLAVTVASACSGAAPRMVENAPAPLSSAVIHAPGRTVEVVGLNRWTVAMIQDSLEKYSPGDSLHSHACAVVLRYKLGFADAAATTFLVEGDPVERVVVSVVEPQDSARVRHRPAPLDTVSTRAEWEPLVGIIRRKPRVFEAAVQHYLDRPGAMPEYLRRDSAGVAQVWSFLEAHRGRTDAALATQVLRAPDPGMYDRLAAVAILLNFPESDTTWWALVETLREENGIVKGAAGGGLVQLARHAARPVDWTPVQPAIHAMLDGTSLFQLTDLMEVLNATGAAPAQARAFLAGGGRMLVAYAGAQSEPVRVPAHALLVRLSGQDFGSDREEWSAWIRGLER